MDPHLHSELPFVAPFVLVLGFFCVGLVMWIVARIRR